MRPTGGSVEFALVLLEAPVAIVTRRKGAVGFEAQPRRWEVERTFGRLTRWRRLNSSRR